MASSWTGGDGGDRGLQRIRLSEWARQQNISRITAYRMLRRRLLPVPSERSPTGRWYVLVPPKQDGRMAVYARVAPGPDAVDNINRQITALTEFAVQNNRSVFTIVREIADPYTHSLPRLQRLLSDKQVTNILVQSPAVIGLHTYALLVAALNPEGRAITSLETRKQNVSLRRSDLRAAIASLAGELHGERKGRELAEHVIYGRGPDLRGDPSE